MESTCHEFTIWSISSPVIRLSASRLHRPQGGGCSKKEGEKVKEATKENIKMNPVLPFTLEEEFKLTDMIVRLQDYSFRHFNFVERNFGNKTFPSYSKLTMENAALTNITGKLPYNPVMEQRLFDLGVKFTQLNIDLFFDDMKYLSAEVKIKMLETSFPATYIVFYAILENNNWMQPQSLGREKVRKIRMADMERFSSPWAQDYADEVKFSDTVRRVGEVLGSDMNLQALFTMLIMISPCGKQVCTAL